MTELERRRRALMVELFKEVDILNFTTDNVNGIVGIREITIPTNSVTNMSQVNSAINSYLETGEIALVFSATSFTNANNGIKYGITKQGAIALIASSSSTGFYGRYKDGNLTEITSETSSYDAKLTAGNKYKVLYRKKFTHTTT